MVQTYLEKLNVSPGETVLDPFCGTGTTLVECKKTGISSIGIEANAMAHFASQVKTDWTVEPDHLLSHARQVAALASNELQQNGIEEFDALPLFRSSGRPDPTLRTLSEEQLRLLLRDSISPLPLHRALCLQSALDAARDKRFDPHERLALAQVIVSVASNLHFGPEVGVGRAKDDAPVIDAWLRAIQGMAADLRLVKDRAAVPALVVAADARQVDTLLEPRTVDAVITSPPYPNEKDYTRTTRLESVLLGFIQTKKQLRLLKQGLVRSNTRNVYKDDNDDRLVDHHPEVQRIAGAIEARRLELGKTSGWERMYARVTKLYFGGMVRHLASLRPILRPGARLAYVVGDQASYLQVMIRTGAILADLAASLGYEVVGLDLFRTRLATATREQLREEVLLLRWPG
jgi:hypothetical protein